MCVHVESFEHPILLEHIRLLLQSHNTPMHLASSNPEVMHQLLACTSPDDLDRLVRKKNQVSHVHNANHKMWALCSDNLVYRHANISCVYIHARIELS